MCEISRLRYLSSRERTDRSFQTDEQAKPARPEVGTASGAFSARPRKRPRWVAQAPSAAPRDARRRPGPRPRASASSPAPRPPRRARRSAPPRGRRGRGRRLRRARPRWRVAVNDCGGMRRERPALVQRARGDEERALEVEPQRLEVAVSVPAPQVGRTLRPCDRVVELALGAGAETPAEARGARAGAIPARRRATTPHAPSTRAPSASPGA